MIMKPLILHGSNKTTNNKKRRVVHIEFSNRELSKDLEWSEKLNWDKPHSRQQCICVKRG
jgi:hypothetical protein